ncbi:MAG TPA: phosphatidylserine/phosphatidylglycerophosphate/cardiolipin synthase family protein [Polyangiaceae bacterium]
MKYRRALVLADPHADPGPALSALRRVAPVLERVIVVGRMRGFQTWWSSEVGGESNAREITGLEAWRVAAAPLAHNAEVRHAPDLPLQALVELALTEQIDLLVAGARSFEAVSLLIGAARRLAVAMLWPGDAERRDEIRHVFCAAIGERSRASIIAFLREHVDSSVEVSAVGPRELPPGELAATLEVLGIRARVDIIPRAVLSLRAALDAAARAGPVDLIVLARVPLLLLVGYAWPAPVLLTPPAVQSGPRPRRFDITDLADVGGAIRGRVEEVSPVRTLSPAADAVLAFVWEGRVVATVTTSPSGELELPASVTAGWLGAVHVVDDAPPDALAAIEQRVAVLRPAEQPLLLFDAELADERLRVLRDAARVAGLEPLAVRLRPTSLTDRLRERLRAANIVSHVLDARAILDEGDAFDVAPANDSVRLRRVASRLRGVGFPVVAVFDRELDHPEPLHDRPALSIEGNQIEVELDNAQARGWLLDAIAQSRHSLNVQVYMALDDEVGRAIEEALAAAVTRGVTTRVLVDSLHGMHGSFGAHNPLLTRLAERPGIELRVGRPLTKLPSVMDVKQRDHRKLVVVDDRLALVGGRNFSHEYYTGFGEAHLDASTTWRQVPWLDAGARIEGPAVAAIAASFLKAWTDAGGAAFAIHEAARAGSAAARIVVHHGLRDAYTLEAYLELVEHARSHIYAVNGFPYVLEFQHALVRAIRKGVRVRVLTGHLTPMHGDTRFTGPWSSARSTATEFVHSRLDPIVEAGGEVYLFAQRELPGSQPDLGALYPHVHAKLMSVDGRRCAVGSANFDVTSSYWESELMVVVEDSAVAARLERRLDQLIEGSARVNRDDPTWRARARSRRWMRKWPGMLAL